MKAYSTCRSPYPSFMTNGEVQVMLPEQEIHHLHFAIGLDQFFTALSAFSWIV